MSDEVEIFRAALMREHHHDWSMEVISEAAHICASAITARRGLTKPLPGDTPEKARERYRKGGFGSVGSPSAEKTYKRYLALFKQGVIKP
jgi:hypothetical protein